MMEEGFGRSSHARPVDGHVHGPVDRRAILALRSIDLHDLDDGSELDGGPTCIGLHPWFVRQESLDEDLARLEGLVRSSRVAAVGETGLDRLRGPDLGIQVAAMRAQIALSEALGLPLVVHCVRTSSDLLALRRATRASRPWIWHGWNLGPAIAERVVSGGSVPSFGAAILREGSKAREVLSELPPGSFLLETDDSGRDIREIEAEAAAIRSMTVSVLRAELHATWVRLFGGG